jgi:hypothetical protein
MNVARIGSEADMGTGGETVRWSAYPSWRHFIWLYCFSAMAGLRGLLALGWGGSGGAAAVWMGGAAGLLACAGGLRFWGKYVLTSRRVVVENGYTGRPTQAIALEQIDEIVVSQGPIAQFFDIGTVAVCSVDGGRVVLSGVRSPGVIRTRIEALQR